MNTILRQLIIDDLCKGEDVEDKFFKCEDENNTYFVFMLADQGNPDDHLKADLGQIKMDDTRDAMKESMGTIKYSTYRSEYFYDHAKK